MLIIRGGGRRGSIDWGTDSAGVMLIRVESNFQLLSEGGGGGVKGGVCVCE